MDIFLSILEFLSDSLLSILVFIAVMYLIKKWDGKLPKRKKKRGKKDV